MVRTPATDRGANLRWGRILLAAILVVALASIAIYLYRHSRQPEPQNASTATPAGDLVSDDRIIFGGIPRAKRPAMQITLLKNKAYMVGYSEERKDPLWSAYRVFRNEHPFVLERPKGNFLTDLRTLAQVAHHDYTESGYDRGHMTPNSAIARCFGAEAQRETFLLSNVCPQAGPLNRDVWEKLERDELEYAHEFSELWVMDGPVFSDVKQPGAAVKKLRSGISVPTAFFKILVEDDSGGRGEKVRAFAVIMPQGVKGSELPAQFVRSIRDVEDETGLEFLWKLDPATQARLKNQAAAMWAQNN